MSDLIRRLRERHTGGGRYVPLGLFAEAASRIEELEAQVREQALNYLSLDGQAEALADRIKADEALLRQALEALEWIAAQRTGGMIQRKATEPIAAIRARLESGA